MPSIESYCRRLFSAIRYPLAIFGFTAFAVLWLWLQYGGVFGLQRSVYCAWCRHAALAPAYRFEGFFDTSTVPQEIDYVESKNWIVRQEGGRSYIAAADPQEPAIIKVQLKKEFDEYVIFPRVAADGEVTVCEATPDTVLFRLRGKTGWTPLGRRYMLNLRCADSGNLPKQISLNLLFILHGKQAQLWLGNGKVVFR